MNPFINTQKLRRQAVALALMSTMVVMLALWAYSFAVRE